jgi:hypothetical protein
MAKKASPQNAVSLAVSTAVGAMVPLLSYAADVSEAASLEQRSIAADMLALVVDLRTQFSGSDYMTAIVGVFGTSGIHATKPDYQKGALRPALLAALTASEKEKAIAAKIAKKEVDAYAAEHAKSLINRVNVRLSETKKVALYIADPVRFAEATKVDEETGEVPTFNAMHEAAKAASPKTVKADKADDATKPGEATVTTAAQVVALFGFDAIMGALIDSLASEKTTALQAKAMSAIRAQVKETRAA